MVVILERQDIHYPLVGGDLLIRLYTLFNSLERNFLIVLPLETSDTALAYSVSFRALKTSWISLASIIRSSLALERSFQGPVF